MDPLQRLLSLGLVQGATTAAGADQVRLSADGAAPELQSLLARLAERLTADPGAAAEAAEQQPRPQQPASRAALDCLEQERQRLEAAAEAQRRRNAASSQRAQACCARAGEQHAAVGSAVQALADCLVPLAASEPSALPLLCVAVPDEVAGGGRALLQSLAERVGCEAGAAGAGHSERAHEQSQRRLQQEEEFARLQAALRLTASAKVQAQAGVARCQAELGALQQAQEKQAHGSGAPGAVALLGRSVDDLEREVQHLQRKLEASLERCQAAAAQASLRHAAAAVAAQRAGRVEHARARCAVKQQAVDLLVRHLARQLLVADLLQQERSTLGQMQALVQAALEDGDAVLAAAQQRRDQLYAREHLAGAGEQPPASQEQDQPSQELLQAVAAALDGSGSASSGGRNGADPPAAVAEQLLQLRAGLRQLSTQVQRELLPGQRGVFAQLHGLAFRGADVSSPELTAVDVGAKLEAADAAATALQQAAMTALGEAQQRQQQAQRRALAEQVLLDFYLHPSNLSKRAEQQRRALDA